LKPKSHRKVLFFLAAFLLLGVRALQVREGFRTQLGVFPRPRKGLFVMRVEEDPQVLFDHEPGGHRTGREGAFYGSYVREVRAVCTALSAEGRPLPNPRVRCSFRMSKTAPARVLSYGDRLEVRGKILRPKPAQNPGSFVAIL
jgi:Domain of unknown function (DUF4131)